MTSIDIEEIVSLTQWAHEHDVHPRIARYWARAGLLPAKFIGRSYVIARDAAAPDLTPHRDIR